MKNKKDLLGGVIIIVLLLLVLVTYMSFYNFKKNEDNILNINDIEDNSLMFINIYEDYSTLKIENKESMNGIDDEKNIVRSYNCKSDDCVVYNSNIFDNIYDDKFIILKEKNKIFIYDFVLDKVVSNLYDEFIGVIDNDYFLVRTNYKSGIISKAGIEVVSTIYDKIDINDKFDSYIKVLNKSLYGILDLDNGNVIVDTKYEDIKVNDSKYFSILKNGLWYVIDKEENIITDGYEYVFGFNKGFIALKDNTLMILKYNVDSDVKLNDSVINLSENDIYNIKRNGSYIDIEINNGVNLVKYQYNISRNNLIVK